MKEDPIKNLIQQSQLETSDGFSEKTMVLIEQRLQQRMKLRLYLFMSFVVLFFSFLVYLLIAAGFTIDVFGLIVSLPKTITMIVISFGAYLTILQSYHLHKNLMRLSA